MYRLIISLLMLCLCSTGVQAAGDEASTAAAAQTAAAPADTASPAAPAESVPHEPAGPELDENGFYIGGPVYVSDKNQVWTRSGPGTNYRITGSRPIGEKMTLLAYSRDRSFVQLQDAEGNTFWMGTKTLQAQSCGQPREQELLEHIAKLEHELATYDTKLSRQVQSLTQKNARLEKENEGMKTSMAQKDSTIEELDELRRDYEDRLQTKELDMQMRWWMQGAAIAFCGAVAGIIFIYLPRPNRKSKRERF